MGGAVEYDGLIVLKSLDEDGSGDDALAVPMTRRSGGHMGLNYIATGRSR
jgi:hypothetical protein